MRRPYILVAVLLLFGLAHAARAYASFQNSIALPNFPASPSFGYLVVSSAAWGLVFFVCAGAAFVRTRRAGWAAILAGVLNQAHVWLERLAFSRSTESLQTLGFALFVSTVLVLCIALPAAVFERQVKNTLRP